MWRKIFTRLLAPDDGNGGGSGGGGGGGAGTNGGDGKGAGGGQGNEGGILSSSKGAGAGAGDDEGGKPGAGGGTGDGGEAWLWGENVPGTGERPAWLKADKYKTVADQARALPELEGKLGPAAELIGPPKNEKGEVQPYALPDTKGVKELEGWEWDAEDPLLKAVQAEAAAMCLSQKAFDRLANVYARVMVANTQQQELQLSEALQKLGPNVEQRVKAVEQFITAKVGAEAFATLDNAIGTDVEAFQALAKIVGLASNDARLASGGGGGGGVGFTRADIEAEQFKVYPKDHALAGQRVYDHDAEHRKKVDGMWSKLFPGEDVNHVG